MNRSSPWYAALALTVANLLTSCAGVAASQEAGSIEVWLSVANGSVVVKVENASADAATVSNPFGTWVVPGTPGLELLIAEVNGMPRAPCAMVDPSPDAMSKSIVVPARSSVSGNIAIDYLAQIFCLEPGRYRTMAVLRDASTGIQESVVDKSNWTEIVIAK